MRRAREARAQTQEACFALVVRAVGAASEVLVLAEPVPAPGTRCVISDLHRLDPGARVAPQTLPPASGYVDRGYSVSLAGCPHGS